MPHNHRDKRLTDSCYTTVWFGNKINKELYLSTLKRYKQITSQTHKGKQKKINISLRLLYYWIHLAKQTFFDFRTTSGLFLYRAELSEDFALDCVVKNGI